MVDPTSDGSAWPAISHGEMAEPLRSHPSLVDRLKAAEILGVSPGTIDNLRKRGELPSLKLMVRRLYDVEDLRRLIDARKEGVR